MPIVKAQAESSLRKAANVAYADLLGKFWDGPPDNGLWVKLQDGRNVDLWQFAAATNALYSYWKVTGSSDATTRIISIWKWVKAHYGVPALTTCGAHSPANFALDDTTADIGYLLETSEVTRDADTLSAAKGALDCGWTRWQDGGTAGCLQAGTPAGALWYNDYCRNLNDLNTNKGSLNINFALVNYWYYQSTGDVVYRTRAIELDNWVAAHLQRFRGTAGSDPKDAIRASPCSQSGPPYVDGLYWSGMGADGKIPPAQTPCQVAERGSVTSLVNNMAAAVLLARLYKDPLTPPADAAKYLSRIVVGSQGIKTYETGCGTGGYQPEVGCQCTAEKHDVFIDDKDAFGQGWFAVMYAREVLPLIKGQSGVLTAVNFIRTANIILKNDRFPDGTYGGSWNGPANSDNCWGHNDNLSVNGSAVNMILAGLAAQMGSP